MPEPFPHQDFAARWLNTNPKTLLADEMGLGKTASAILAARRAQLNRILVVCPAVARRNWQREVETWYPGMDAVTIEDGLSANTFATFYTSVPQATYIISYALAAQPKFIAQIFRWRPDVIIYDEAQYLKNPEAKRTYALYHGSRFSLANAAPRVWALTGTPMPSNPGELYTHFAALAPNLIKDTPDYPSFLARFCDVVYSSYGQQIKGSRNTQILRDKLADLMLRRTASEVLDLPPLVWGSKIIESDDPRLPGDLGDIADLTAEDLIRRHEQQNDGEFSTLRRLVGERKALLVAGEAIDRINDGALNKLVIFAHHRSVLDLMYRSLSSNNMDPALVHGAISPQKTQEEIDRFTSDPYCHVFLGQITKCATAINLQAANHIWFAESSWVPADNAQAAKRCHRIGQTQACFITVWSLADSMDEALNRVLVRKAKDIAAIVENAPKTAEEFDYASEA